MRPSRNFDPVKYWGNKPYCSICKKKKVRTGNICSDCQKEGLWPSKVISTSPENTSQDEIVIDYFSSPQVERFPITEKVQAIAGYLKDCALATMRSYNLDDIRNLKDVSFIEAPADVITSLKDSGVFINNEDSYALAYKAVARLADLDLLLGSVFLVGSRKRNKDKKTKFFAPLLLIQLEASITKEGVFFKIKDDSVQLNTSLFSKLLDNLPEDELEIRLQDIYNSIPVWPFSTDDLTDFVELVKNVFPEAFVYDKETSMEVKSLKEIEAGENDVQVYLTHGIVLSPKKEAEGTIIKELLLLSENILDQTGVDNIFCDTHVVANDQSTEATVPISDDTAEDSTIWSDLNPLDLSENKKQIVQAVRSSKLSVITGPPGTGKSFTIQAIILDHLLAGKKVLFVSKMDKAVDVVASAIEKLVGPYAVARSGARAAQRGLAEKIELITGATTPIKKVTKHQIESEKLEYDALKDKIQKLQDDFSRLLTQEREWSKVAEMAKQFKAQVKTIETIKNIKIEPSHAEKLKSKVKGADALLRNKGFFLKTWWGSQVISNIQQRLNLPPNTPVEEIISVIEVLKNETLKEDIETEIQAFNEINVIWTEISQLKDSIHKKALQVIRNILLGNLYVILNNHPKRQELKKLLQALKAANQQQKKVLLDQVSAETLVSAFPFWASTANHLSQFLPLKPGLFDLVIFDEASQCDLASALPALYRGNKVVVVGDPKQLNHVVIMSRSIEQSAVVDNKVLPEDRLAYKFSDRSLFDVAEDKVEQRNSFILEEHYRSDPRIISFSSDHFYSGSLRIMTQHPNKTRSQQAIEVHYIDGKRRENSTENPDEVKALFETLSGIINQTTNLPLTFGILSPFRDQVNAIAKQLPQYLSADQFNQHEIVVGTAHSLQGDEKDIVLLSLSLDKDYHHGTLRFLETPNVFNVAITRAKKKLIVFSSVTPNDLPNGLLKSFLEYANGLIEEPIQIDKFDSNFEREVAEALRSCGLSVWSQYEAAGFKIDLVVGYEGEYIAVECDGPTHFDMDEKAPFHDVWRQEILERAGWRFIRISYRDWEKNRSMCVEKITNCLHITSSRGI